MRAIFAVCLLVSACDAEQALSPDAADDAGTSSAEPDAGITIESSGTRTIRVIQFNLTGHAVPGIFPLTRTSPTGPFVHANYGSLEALKYLEWEMGRFVSPSHPPIASPDLVLLEEVCYGQYEDLAARYPSAAFTPMVADHAMCHTGSSRQLGDMLLSPWPITNITRTELGSPDPGTFGSDTTKWKYFRLTCADVHVPGLPKPIKGCVAHLRAGNPVDQYKSQVDKIATVLDASVTAGQPVIFGGDLNNKPEYRTLDELYRLDRVGGWNGRGLFNEADQGDASHWGDHAVPCTATACRAGQRTTATLLSNGCIADKYKFDYVFFSRFATATGGFSSVSAASMGFVPLSIQPAACRSNTYTLNFQAGPIDSLSDHHLYRAEATLTF